MAVKLIHGTDEYLVSQHARRSVATFCPENEQALGLETIAGGVKTIADAIEALKAVLGALRTVGLFGGQKTVWFRDVAFLKDKVVSKNKEVKELLGALVEDIKNGLPAGHHLVISAPGVDRRSAFYKACQSAGEICAYELPEQEYLRAPLIRERAQQLFDSAHCRVSSAAIGLFLEKVGADTRQLAMEAEKLILYVGERSDIGVEDVKAITSSSAEAITWDFTDALGARRLDESLGVLRQLLFQGESPVMLMFAIESLFRSLLQFRSYLDQGWLRLTNSRGAGSVRWVASAEQDSMFARLPVDPRKMHWFRVGKLGQQAKNYSAEELRICQQRLLETHEQLVSGAVGQATLLEMLVIKLVSTSRARR